MDSCLLCRTGILIDPDTSLTSAATPSQLDRSTRVIFLLRKLLNLAPTHNLVRKYGHPGDWISLCPTCDDLVIQGTRLFDQITKLELEFDSVKERVQSVVRVKQEIREEDDGDHDDMGDDSATSTIRRYLVPNGNSGGGFNRSMNGTNSEGELIPNALVKVELDESMSSVEEENDQDPLQSSASQLIETFFTTERFLETLESPQRKKSPKRPPRKAPPNRPAETASPGYKCTLCGKVLRSRGTLEGHIRQQHAPPKILTCRGCHKFYVGSKEFNQHLTAPKKEACRRLAFPCPVRFCSRVAFSSKRASDLHVRCRHQA